MILKGETAKMLIEMRNRGVIRSFSDGVCQGIQALYDKIAERDYRAARFHALQASQNGEGNHE